MAFAAPYLVATATPFLAALLSPRLGVRPQARRSLLLRGLVALPLAWLGVTLVFQALVDWTSPATGGLAWGFALLPALALALLTLAAAAWPPLRRVLAWSAVGAVVAGLFLEPVDVLLGGLAATLLAAALPWLGGAVEEGRQGAGWLAFGVLFALLALLLIALLAPEDRFAPREATHAWSLTVEAPDDATRWTVEAPFLSTDSADAARILAALRSQVRVTDGDAAVFFVDDGARVRIEGRGDAKVAATFRFHGSERDLEAFRRYASGDGEVRLDADAPLQAMLTWRADMDAGSPLHCWYHEEAVMTLDAGSATSLAPTRQQAQTGAGHVPLFCHW